MNASRLPSTTRRRLSESWIATLVAVGLAAMTAPALLAYGQGAGDKSTQPAAGGDERFDLKVRNDFFSGLAGDKTALERGMKACEETLAKNPKFAEAMVWHGSGLMFMAGEAFNGGDQKKGMELWNRSLKEMSEAVKLKPDSIGVRIPRGATLMVASRYMPDPQQKQRMLQDAVADYGKAYQLQKENLDKLGVHPRGELLFGLAEGWRRLGNEKQAKTYLDQIVKTCPDSPWEAEAKEWLAKPPATPEMAAHTCIGCHVP